MDKRDYQQLKARLFRKIVQGVDFQRLRKASGDSARDELLVVIRSVVNAEVVPLSFAERERLAREMLDAFGDALTTEEERRKKVWLTTKEIELVCAVVAGYSNREIAAMYKIPEVMVKQHLSDIFAQLGVAMRLLRLRATDELDSPEDGETAGFAVKRPKSPNLNSGSAAANLDELT